MTDTLSDYRQEEDLNFEDSRERELARRQAVNDLIPLLPPPPHQLSPEESKLEFERLKAEAYAELELEEMDEEHLFMQKATTMLSQLLESAGFDENYERPNQWKFDAYRHSLVAEKEYEAAIIGLAIGYARIDDIAKTKQIITDYVEYWAKIEKTKSLRTLPALEDIQARNEEYKLELHRKLAATVAYYSDWIGGLSSKEDVAEFAKTVSDPTQDFSSRLIPVIASDYYQHLRGEISQQGEEAVFSALKQYEQEIIEVRNLQIKLSKSKTVDEHYKDSEKYRNLKEEYIKRKSFLEDQRIVLSVVLMELAARKHKEHLEAINSGKQAGVLKPHLELN
ncbi:MAG: hypothetical protein NT114_01345 [Patescibacteria group bacterium]|nr:hypothetical protein [Patescibacteria group bacterium]